MDRICQLRVTPGLTVSDLTQSLPDSHLKSTADELQGNLKTLTLLSKILLKLLGRIGQ
jgi:hypothetical protein